MLRKTTKRLTVDKQSPGYHVASGGTQGVKCDLIRTKFSPYKKEDRAGSRRRKRKEGSIAIHFSVKHLNIDARKIV